MRGELMEGIEGETVQNRNLPCGGGKYIDGGLVEKFENQKMWWKKWNLRVWEITSRFEGRKKLW